MSLKSFDKFCERMILAEPGSEKEIFDERQNIMRLRLATEALFIYAGLTVVNSLVMEHFYQWSESWTVPLLLFMVMCVLWCTVRYAVKGCLLPVSGKAAQKYSAITGILVGAVNTVRFVFDIGEEDYFVTDGMLSEDFLFTLSFLLLIGCGIFMLCFMRYEEKKSGEEVL